MYPQHMFLSGNKKKINIFVKKKKQQKQNSALSEAMSEDPDKCIFFLSFHGNIMLWVIFRIAALRQF